MDVNDFKEKVKIAKETVEGEEEPYKTEGYKIILSHLLNTKNKLQSYKKIGKSKKRKQSVSSKTKITFEQKHDLEELTSKCKISEEKIKETIAIKNDIIEILKRITAQEKFKQMVFSMIILATYRVIFEIEWLPASYLRKCLDSSGVGDLNHLYRNLPSTSLIVNSGAKKGTEYKITGKGMDLAFEYIKKLADGENINES